VAAYLAEALLFVFSGRAIIDEGVYLNAGRLVYEGQLPYRDFPFSQGPLVAYVYGAVLQLFGSSVLVGRWLSFALGLCGFGAALWIARALAGRGAMALAVVLSMLNLPMLWISSTVRTQSLSTPLAMLAVLALAVPRRGAWTWAISPSLMLWSTSARLTNALAFLAIALWTGLQLRGQPGRLAKVAVIVGAQALLVFAPIFVAPGKAGFHIFLAQLGRSERTGPKVTSYAQDWIAKFSIFLEPETSFFAIVGLTLVIAVALAATLRGGWRPDFARPLHDPRTAQLTLIALSLLVFLPHLLLDRGFLTYFVTSSALLVPAVAIGITGLARDARPGRAFALVAVAVLLVGGCVGASRHTRAWIGSGDSSFGHFREVAREIRETVPGECTIATMETALAVETGCRVLSGLEYSLFSYFPRLDDETATKFGVVNAALLASRVRADRPELIVLGPRGRSSLGLGSGRSQPPSLGFLAPDGYTYLDRHRISGGALVRRAPDTVPVDVFVRDDLIRNPAPRLRRTP
jgi:hypothetical protein